LLTSSAVEMLKYNSHTTSSSFIAHSFIQSLDEIESKC
jgi:hypothetical protein